MTTQDNKPALPVGPLPKAAYSVGEIAALLGLHRVTVSKFISRGELRAARLGHRTVRITHEALMDFLKSKESTPTENLARKVRRGT